MPGHFSLADLLYAGIEQLDEARVTAALDQGAPLTERAGPHRLVAGSLAFSALWRTTRWDRADHAKAMAIEQRLLAHPQAPIQTDLWKQWPVIAGVTQMIMIDQLQGHASHADSVQRMQHWLRHPEVAAQVGPWGCACTNALLDILGKPDDRLAVWRQAGMMDLARDLVVAWVPHGFDLVDFERLPGHDPRRAAVQPLLEAAQRSRVVQVTPRLGPGRPRRRS